jgi:hypothetical protein
MSLLAIWRRERQLDGIIRRATRIVLLSAFQMIEEECIYSTTWIWERLLIVAPTSLMQIESATLNFV